MSLFSKKTKITIHAFTRLLAQCIIKANPINCQLIEKSESLSSKEKKKIISELLYFRLVLLYFMLLFERRFGRKDYYESELMDILPLGLCLAFEDNGTSKKNAQERAEISMDRVQHYRELLESIDKDVVKGEEDVYFELVKRFVNDMFGVNEVELVERFNDKRFATKHHEVLHFVSQAYHLDDNNFKNNLKEFKFIE